MRVARPDEVNNVIIKVTGPRVLVEAWAEALEEKHGSHRISQILPNDREAGVHVFLLAKEAPPT